MKRMLLLSSLVLAVASARAGIFFNSSASVDSGHFAAGQDVGTPVESGNSFELPLGNPNVYTIDSNNLWWGDVAWKYEFDSPVAYQAVCLIITGTLAEINLGGQMASLDFAINEKVYKPDGFGGYDTANPMVDRLDSGTILEVGSGSNWSIDAFGNWTIATCWDFRDPDTGQAGGPYMSSKLGQAQKDFLHFTVGLNTIATINSVKQTFDPVPEPATLAIIGLGIAGIARRKARR